MATSMMKRASFSARSLCRPLANAVSTKHGLGCVCDACASGQHGKDCMCSTCGFKGFEVCALSPPLFADAADADACED